MKNLQAIHPNEWEHTQAAENIINAPGQGSGHERIMYGIVEDTEQSVFYFATKSAIYLPPPANIGDLSTAIYAFDPKKQSFERLFKREAEYDYDATDPNTLETFYVLGIDNGYLIVQILKQAAPDDPQELWKIPFGNTASGPVKLDLQNPYSKRAPYDRT